MYSTNYVQDSQTQQLKSQDFAEQLIDQVGILDEETATLLVKSFSAVSRANLTSCDVQSQLFDDVPLPVEYGRVIPKPSYVARMLGLIGIRKYMRVLELGCGAGYCSALLAAAGVYVYATEANGALAQHTRKRLDSMGYQNVLVRMAELEEGWAEYGPYDAIVISQPVANVSRSLFSQLITTNGLLVAPVGDESEQKFCLWETNDSENPSFYQLEACNFNS